jgi:hypothetical protein
VSSPDEPEDPTPLPPPAPGEHDSTPDYGAAVADEDRAAREAANIPRPVAAEPIAHEDQPDSPAPADSPDRYDRALAFVAKWGPLIGLAAITITIFAIHARIFRGETAGDDLSFHYAESARLYDCLRYGDFDFWNPSANAGYASLYYYQAIPQLASAIPAAIFGHHLFWFQLSVILPLVLAPAAAYKGMRLMGATPWQAFAGAFLVAFMNGESRWGAGSAGTFNVGLYTQTWSLCAFPLALGYALRWMTQGERLASAAIWSGFVFLCHPFGGISLVFAIVLAFITNAIVRASRGPIAGESPTRYIPRSAVGLVVKLALDTVRVLRRFKEVRTELARAAILGGLFLLATLPVALPLFIDSAGFGGFPHRVADEVGPGFHGLWKWYSTGALFDFMPAKVNSMRLDLITWLLPVTLVLAFVRRLPGRSFFKWLWVPGLLYALMLGLGPSMGKIGDDVFPPVRFLGAMQTLFAMAVGAGVVSALTWWWHAFDDDRELGYWMRTGIISLSVALLVLVAVPGTRALSFKVRVFGDSDPRRSQLVEISHKLGELPQGRKQAGPGAENHWWNTMPYVWDRVPSTLQMGGGGLQASPNYDFLWTQRDFVKNAWIYDAPYVLFMTSRGKNIPNGETIITTKDYEVRRLPSPGLVSPVQIVGTLPPGYHKNDPGHKKALEWLRSDRPMKDQLLAYSGFGGVSSPPHGKTLRAWRQDSPGDDADIVADVETESPTTFVIRESWHPRWHAYIDGAEVPVRRVTPDFPAVDVPAGKHTIEARFERPWWAQAAWLGWPLPPLAIYLFGLWQRRRRRLATAES